jgi:hypothetical protein
MNKQELKQLIKECMMEISSGEYSVRDIKGCTCKDCPKCKAHTVCGKCGKCARCDKHTEGCEGCPGELETESIVNEGNSPVDIGDGFYIHKTGLDVNGNSCVWVSKGANKPKRIQTNGNTPSAHQKKAEEIAANEEAKQQIKDYYTRFIKTECGMVGEISDKSNDANKQADQKQKNIEMLNNKFIRENISSVPPRYRIGATIKINGQDFTISKLDAFGGTPHYGGSFVDNGQQASGWVPVHLADTK